MPISPTAATTAQNQAKQKIEGKRQEAVERFNRDYAELRAEHLNEVCSKIDAQLCSPSFNGTVEVDLVKRVRINCERTVVGDLWRAGYASSHRDPILDKLILIDPQTVVEIYQSHEWYVVVADPGWCGTKYQAHDAVFCSLDGWAEHWACFKFTSTPLDALASIE